MAVLSDQDRAAVAADGMRDPALGTLSNLLKTDWRAAVDAVDNWVNSNAGAFNNAIPQPARANLSSSQKALLLVFVVLKRWSAGV